MKLSAQHLYGVILTSILVSSCAMARTSDTIPTTQSNALIRSDYKPKEITALCKAAIDNADTRLKEIAQLPAAKATVTTALLPFETILADLNDEANGLTFMGYVSTDEVIRNEGSACEETLGQYYVTLFTRRDLYNALLHNKPRNANEKRLLTETLRSFEKNGLKLSDEKLAELKTLLGEISRKETKFSANLNNDTSSVEFTEAELKGVTSNFLSRLKKSSNGKYIVTTKSTDYNAVMENAENPETRKRIMAAYFQRGGAENTQLLEEAVALRAQVANKLGFATWVDYRTSDRMAKSLTNVRDFVTNLKTKLATRNSEEYAQLLKMKKETYPQATSLDQWDVAYYNNQMKKRDYNVDTEVIREYFPAHLVVAGLFKVYSTLLGVEFKEVANAEVWSPDVKLYEIIDAKTKTRIGHFYADFFPRAGKYGHAAAFTLISGRKLGPKYEETVSAIVSNFSPASADKPSLLTHDEVETLFHEFGHIMHQTLTKAPYASLSGSSTARDFVEAPSQMLENWVWNENILNMISGHYKDETKKLPKALLDKMLAAKDFGQGRFYTRQLMLGIFDMTIHSQAGKVDVTKAYEDVYRDVIGQEPIAGGRFPGTFGHMMGGYDAGYYGYLWSEVYAQDMFSLFEKRGLLNTTLGSKYRKAILEKGGMQDAIDLLRKFLGREPNSDAFFRSLKI